MTGSKAPLIELLYKKPTRKLKGHTLVILNESPIGFFLPDRGLGKDENYHLSLDYGDESIREYFKDRKDVVKFIGEFVKGKFPGVVLLHDHLSQRKG